MSDSPVIHSASDISAKEMKSWLRTARTLSEALPYMRHFAGTTMVVKYGGHAMGEAHLAKTFAEDVVLLKQVGINPVVVHGGGPQIKHMLDRLKIQSRFVDGLRVTDAETVEVVEMVLAGTINAEIVSAINRSGGFAVGLSGKDGNLIRAKKVLKTRINPDTGETEEVDLGFVGEPHEINTHILGLFEKSDVIPVISPVGVDEDGQTYNINADTAAGAIAAALKAVRLLMLTDVTGVLDGEKQLVPELSSVEARRLIAEGIISGGMIPKVETCLDAVENGVGAAVIQDGRVPHAVLLEIFTPHGAGTLIRNG